MHFKTLHARGAAKEAHVLSMAVAGEKKKNPMFVFSSVVVTTYDWLRQLTHFQKYWIGVVAAGQWPPLPLICETGDPSRALPIAKQENR